MEDEIDNLNFAEDEEEEEGSNLYDPSNQANPTQKKKKKKKIELTDKERDKIKLAVIEMKDNQVQPQYTCGRKFVGAGFASNPPKIIYKDFEVGKKMSLTIDITNISYSFNSFHLQPLDDDIIDFFEIDYKPCGRIPAGISTKMTLHFTPLVNKDYKSNLKLLSETGMCEIPIECYCKKCVIEFDKSEINWGEVILGQDIPININVSNNGALACKFTMCDNDKNLLLNPDEDEEKENEFDLEPSYKDFTDRKIILHKNDFNNSNSNIYDGILDMIKKEKVKLYREKLIEDERNAYEAKKKEEEDALAQAQAAPQGKDAKGKKDNKVQKKGGKDQKEPEVELVNGIPVETMNDIEKRVENYSANYKIESKEDQKIYDDEEARIKFKNMKYYLIKQLQYPLHGHFDAYSKKNVTIMLNAKFIGNYELDCYMKIDYKGKTEYKPYKIKFSVVDLPIYSQKKIYDLDYIIYDTIFREKITLVNDSPMPYKLQVFFHKDLKDYIELNPNLGYIQANSTFDIWMKLKVDKNINKLFSFFKAENTEENIEYNFPLKIVLNNIQIPLISIIHFWVTNDKVKISEKFIDYGKRPIDESTLVKVSLENTSHLPMKYGFIMLPKEFTVRTNIDNLLSNEKTFVDIIYEPKDDFLGHREGDIFCKVVTDKLTCQNIKIKYHIELQNPEIKMTPKKIKFEALAEGESKEVRILIVNKSSDKAFDCEFLTPPKCISGITIMPKVFTIMPKKYNTCVIRYDSEFREYNAFSFEEIEKELGIKMDEGPEQMEKNIEINGNENKLLEEKVKKEVDNELGAAQDTGDKKGKKGAPAKEVKKDNKKQPDPKKDKKQIEEEEKKKKEEEEAKLKEAEEKKQLRIKNFNMKEELKYFGAEHVYKDTEDDRSSHWKFLIPLYYRIHQESSYSSSENVNNENGATNTDANPISTQINNNSVINPTNNEQSNTNINETKSVNGNTLNQNSNSAKTNEISKAGSSPSNPIQLKATYLEVHTTTVEKLLNFDKDEVDFGEVSVKTRKTINLVLTNNSDKTAVLKMKPLILTNCFRIVNAVRNIPAGESFNFIVEFLPEHPLPYFDEFTVYTNEMTSTILLKGKGVQPEVELSVKDGLFFLGNTVRDNVIEKTFEIINKSDFKIEFSIKELKSGKKNKLGLKPFCYVPYCGEIEGKGKVTVKVSFNGDHQDFENFFDYVLIDVPNQKVENKLLVWANCWDRQVYWKELTVTKFPTDDNAMIQKYIDQDGFVNPLKLKSNSISSNNDKIILVFTPESEEEALAENVNIGSVEINADKKGKKGDKKDTKTESKNETNKEGEMDEEKEKCFKRKIIIGNCKLNDPKNEKNGNYEIIMDKDNVYFTCDNPKGAVNGGTETVISFGFKKPATDPITEGIDCLKHVGTWVTSTAELKINGGFIQNGMSDNVSINIILKAYIYQI